MAAVLDAERLLGWPFRDVRWAYEEKDTILYALSVGLGSDPADADQLRYVYEKGLQAFPTMLTTLGIYGDDQWITDPGVGIDLPTMLHTEIGLTFHAPLPPSGEVVSRLTIDRLIDRGEGRGAFLDFSRAIRSADSGELIATETNTFFMRGNGGFGGTAGTRPRLPSVPEGPPDAVVDLETPRTAALLFRLLGDHNPIHVDPVAAASVGFPVPILHGSCTFGWAGHGVVKAALDSRADRLTSIAARFSAPVFPGETLQVQVWDVAPGESSFRVVVPARDVVVVDNGVARHS